MHKLKKASEDLSFQYSSEEVALLLHAFLREEKGTLSYPFGEDYLVRDAMVDPANAGLVKVEVSYKGEQPRLKTLAYDAPTSRFFLSQIQQAQVKQPDLPKEIYICEDYLGIYTGGNRYVGDIEPVEERDLEAGQAYIRILGYTQDIPVPQLCWAARQIDEHGKKEHMVLSPMQTTALYTEILVAYLTCRRTERRHTALLAKGKTSLVYSATQHLYPFLLPAESRPYTPYTDLGKVPNGTRVAFLDCICQQCQFHKRTSNAGWGRSHAPGGYNWGNLYPNCALYAGNEPGKYCWLWATERVRPTSVTYAKGPILASPVSPSLAYETGAFQVGAWIFLWKHDERYVGIVQAVLQRQQATVCYGVRRDAQTGPCETLEQAETTAQALWHHMQKQDNNCIPFGAGDSPYVPEATWEFREDDEER